MVKQTKSANLQEAAKKAKRGKITGWIALILGSVSLSIGLNFFVDSMSYVLILGGLVIAIIGFYSITASVRKEALLTKELYSPPKRALKCPSCGRKIPQENFGYCPFCGHKLNLSSDNIRKRNVKMKKG
jgi:predicted RNA-binding Zn-ribbon protein involved in translation (DUF1610 family)